MAPLPAARCTLSASATTGLASCSVAYTPGVAGAAQITAGYPGDGDHASSSATALVAAAGGPPTTGPPSTTAGTSVTNLSVTVNGPSIGNGGDGGNAGPCGGGGGGGGGNMAGGGTGGEGGCFFIPSGQRIASGRVIIYVRVAHARSIIRADAHANLTARARAARLALIGRALKRGVPAGRYRLSIKLSSRARRSLAHARKAIVTLHITLTGPDGRSASATRPLILKR